VSVRIVRVKYKGNWIEPGSPCFIDGEYIGIVVINSIANIPNSTSINDGKIPVLQKGTVICRSSEGVKAGNSVSWDKSSKRLGHVAGEVLPHTRWKTDAKANEQAEVEVNL
jgi:hypothetical protein